MARCRTSLLASSGGAILANGRAPGRRRDYSLALARGVPRSFPHALSMDSDVEISYETAARQQDHYVSTLRTVVPTLLVDASESHPDCPFVEDTAVVVRNRAVVCRPGATTRRGEVHAIKDALLLLGFEVVDMADGYEISSSTDAPTCDGGDVLFPVGYRPAAERDEGGVSGGIGRKRVGANVYGRHMFVGISSRTNEAGYEALKRAFESDGGGDDGRSLEVVPVPLPRRNSTLHLKSIVAHLDERTLLAPVGEEGDEFLKAMGAVERGYTVVRLPDVAACNVVSVNGVVLAPPTACEETRRLLEKTVVDERGWELVYEDASEFAKCDGALTCKNILLDV